MQETPLIGDGKEQQGQSTPGMNQTILSSKESLQILNTIDKSIGLGMLNVIYEEFINRIEKSLGHNIPIDLKGWHKIEQSYFKDKYILLIDDIAKNPLSIMMIANDSKYNEKEIAILIGIQTFSNDFYLDENNGILGVDKFIIYKDGKLQYGYTTKPVMIDGVYLLVSDENYINPRMPGQLLLNPTSLLEKTSCKIENKIFFIKNRFETPYYDIIPKDIGQYIEGGNKDLSCDDVNKYIENHIKIFIDKNQNTTQFVIKGNRGCGGTNVYIHNRNDITGIIGSINKLHSKGHDVIIETRITPAPIEIDEKHIDYNLRLIFSYHSDPIFAGGIIRYSEFSDNPVNICTGASYESLDSIKFRKYKNEIDSAIKKSTNLVKKLYKELNDGYVQNGLIGIDIMIGNDGKIYFLEINAGHVGGIHALMETKKTKIQGIKDLVSQWGEQLHFNKQSREQKYNIKLKKDNLRKNGRYIYYLIEYIEHAYIKKNLKQKDIEIFYELLKYYYDNYKPYLSKYLILEIGRSLFLLGDKELAHQIYQNTDYDELSPESKLFNKMRFERISNALITN